jgi:hypothetical protein
MQLIVIALVPRVTVSARVLPFDRARIGHAYGSGGRSAIDQAPRLPTLIFASVGLVAAIKSCLVIPAPSARSRCRSLHALARHHSHQLAPCPFCLVQECWLVLPARCWGAVVPGLALPRLG